jgi:endonuclease/exonuclease/phosphatase family metal-dependent hydrolase
MKSFKNRPGMPCAIAVFLVFASGSLWAAQPHPFEGNRTATVMTWNLYLGTDLTPLFAADNVDALVQAVTTRFAEVEATDFPARAQAIADRIAEVTPDLIGLQEAVLWRSQLPADLSPVPNATTVEFDFLQILLDALSSRGLHYAPAAMVVNSDAEAPRLRLYLGAPVLEDIRLTDRDVILARTDLPVADLKLSNPQGANFETNLRIPFLDGYTTIFRGWVSVDAKIRGRSVRIVSVHLEDFLAEVQTAQALELLAGPADTELPVLLIGDFNSPADGTGTATYGILRSAGFGDAWEDLFPADSGFTCCQAENLLNGPSLLEERIDLILFRGDFSAADADLVGEEQADRTATGLWPSDHAGVAAIVRFR